VAQRRHRCVLLLISGAYFPNHFAQLYGKFERHFILKTLLTLFSSPVPQKVAPSGKIINPFSSSKLKQNGYFTKMLRNKTDAKINIILS